MTSFQKSPQEKLRTPVQYLKGVGPQRAELLNKLDLKTAADVLFLFPRTYQDASRLAPINKVVDGELATVCGTVEEIDLHNTGPGRSYLGVLIRDQTEYLRAVWFNQPFMRQRFFNGQRVMLSGNVRINGLRPEMAHPQIEQLADDEEAPAGKIMPIYPLTEGLKQHQMRKIMRLVVDEFAALIDETFPDDFLRAHDLWPIGQALPEVHFPSDEGALERARRRFIYQELLVMQLALAERRRMLALGARAPKLPTSGLIDARICRRLPFALTGDQETVIQEITTDMARDAPMNRLLHGEVGSGKTAVAVYAMLVAVAGGHQAALMAPTEVLAQQHFRTLNDLLGFANSRGPTGRGDLTGGEPSSSDREQARVRLALLSGSLTPAQRRDTLARIAAGEVDIVVGTHAIVQEDVQFANLGLIVIDEQHKFGVRQRAHLRGTKAGEPSARGYAPHTLIMSATPIPRTVAMSLFGDLDVSTLRHAPPGRQKVHTYVISTDAGGSAASSEIGESSSEATPSTNDVASETPATTKWWDFFRQKLREGRQGYVITPLIDDGGASGVASVQAEFESLANGELADFRMDLVHGRMSAAEKEAAMEAFRRGQTQVLVATSVVEVGVDVPNATVMTIEDGQRFGLAQLHQLRGRVSRGTQPGYVCVLAACDTEDSTKRLEAFARTSDGFELAELDFQLRGPGDLLGTRQHGMPPLRIADLQRDTVELEAARRDAQQLVDDQPRWHSPPLARLRQMVFRRYGQTLELGDVG